MATFKIYNDTGNVLQRALTACQMAWGCIYEYLGDTIQIYTFDDSGDAVRDTLADNGARIVY